MCNPCLHMTATVQCFTCFTCRSARPLLLVMESIVPLFISLYSVTGDPPATLPLCTLTHHCFRPCVIDATQISTMENQGMCSAGS